MPCSLGCKAADRSLPSPPQFSAACPLSAPGRAPAAGMRQGRRSTPLRPAVDAYRASPGGDGSWRQGRTYAAAGDQLQAPGLDHYGLEYAEGLPAFEGNLVQATCAGGPATSAGEAAEQYLALLCRQGMDEFKAQHAWDPQLVPLAETVLRELAQASTPSSQQLHARLEAMSRLKELARSGIAFCVGLDLEPYGSFVSGLYTPTGDLDLSIEGQASWRDEHGQPQFVTVEEMERDMKVRFLRALASRIQAARLSAGPVDRILHARVPILKFVDRQGLHFDVGIGGSQALFKSSVMGLLAQYDWRFGALVRLVKLWARHHDLNDAANGTLNSFALTLLVVFHLQTRRPAVLPPLCQLFGLPPDGERPLQEGRFPDWRLLERACASLSDLSARGGPGGGNGETLLELLASFLALVEGLTTRGWVRGRGDDTPALCRVLRRVRVDCWAGRLRYERWDREGYRLSIEDPFDSADNCARTVRMDAKAERMADAAWLCRRALLTLDSKGVLGEALLVVCGQPALHAVQKLVGSDSWEQAVPWVPPVDLIVPPRIQRHMVGHLPPTVSVNHRKPRGGGANVAQGMAGLALEDRQPGGVDGGRAAEAAVVAPQAGEGPAAAARLQELKQLMAEEVAVEAALIVEAERAAAEAAEAARVAKQARKAAKREVQAAERQRQKEERQREKQQQGGGGGGGGGAGIVSAAGAAAAAAVGNQGNLGASSLGLPEAATGSRPAAGTEQLSGAAADGSQHPAVAAPQTAAGEEPGGSGSDGGAAGPGAKPSEQGKRHGRNMKEAARERKERRAAVGDAAPAPNGGAAAAWPPVGGTRPQQQQPGPQAGRQGQTLQGSGAGRGPRQRSGAGRGPRQRPAAAPAAAAVPGSESVLGRALKKAGQEARAPRVLTVPRPPPPPPPTPGPASAAP